MKNLIGYVLMGLGIIAFFGGIRAAGNDGTPLGYAGAAAGIALIAAAYLALRPPSAEIQAAVQRAAEPAPPPRGAPAAEP